jgi:hypothetical protein
MGNSTLTLSASTQDVTNYVTLKFDKTSLPASSTSTLTVTVNPATLSSSTTGKIVISTGDVSIPVDVTLELNIQTTVTEGAGITVNPALWAVGDCLVDEVLSDSFTLQNLGESEVTDLDYKASSGVQVTGIELPDSIEADAFESLQLEITPAGEKVSGSVEITSSGGSAKIYVSINCVSKDMEDDILTLQSDVDNLKGDFYDAGFDEDMIAGLFYFLDEELKTASSNIGAEGYNAAKQGYVSAQARYDTLGSFLDELGGGAPTPNGGDNPLFTWAIIAVAVVIIAVLGFLLYSKFGSKIFRKGGGEDEEAIDEELY